MTDKLYCPYCGAVPLHYEIIKLSETSYRVDFSCTICEMEWKGPNESGKTYSNGKKADSTVTEYYIKKKITQDYVENSK